MPAAYGTQPGAHAVVRLATADGPESTGPSSQATCAGQEHGAMASQCSPSAAPQGGGGQAQPDADEADMRGTRPQAFVSAARACSGTGHPFARRSLQVDPITQDGARHRPWNPGTPAGRQSGGSKPAACSACTTYAAGAASFPGQAKTLNPGDSEARGARLESSRDIDAMRRRRTRRYRSRHPAVSRPR